MKDNFDDTLTDKQIKDLVTYIEEKEVANGVKVQYDCRTKHQIIK